MEQLASAMGECSFAQLQRSKLVQNPVSLGKLLPQAVPNW